MIKGFRETLTVLEGRGASKWFRTLCRAFTGILALRVAPSAFGNNASVFRADNEIHRTGKCSYFEFPSFFKKQTSEVRPPLLPTTMAKSYLSKVVRYLLRLIRSGAFGTNYDGIHFHCNMSGHYSSQRTTPNTLLKRRGSSIMSPSSFLRARLAVDFVADNSAIARGSTVDTACGSQSVLRISTRTIFPRTLPSCFALSVGYRPGIQTQHKSAGAYFATWAAFLR